MLPHLSQHHQEKAAPSRLPLWPPAAPPHPLVLALGLIWLWDELEERRDLACTAAQELVLLQGMGSHGAKDLGGQGMILPILVTVALQWAQAVSEITLTGQDPSFFSV